MGGGALTLGFDTANLQALTIPQLTAVFANFGHDVMIVGAETVDTSGPPDEYGNWPRVFGGATAVRGYLYQLSERQRAQYASAGAQTDIPQWRALLPISAPVNQPGFTLMWQEQTFYPKGDARDIGNQGVAWSVDLSAPGAR